MSFGATIQNSAGGLIKIALATFCDEAQADIDAVSRPSRVAYCRRHGYELIEHREALATGRTPHWNKIFVILKYLDAFDWVVWIDTDAVIFDLDRRLETIIGQAPESDLLVCKSPPPLLARRLFPPWLNSGVMFCRNSDWTRSFFDAVLRQPETLRPWRTWRWGFPGNFDQDAIIYTVMQGLTGRQRRRVRRFPYTAFNAREYSPTTPVQPFIVHFPGDDKLRRMNEYRQRVRSK